MAGQPVDQPVRPMRILVLPHDLGLGGSINAVELAAAVRDRGHEVTVAAPPGPLADRLMQSGMPYMPVDAPTFSGARICMRQVSAVVARGFDVIHAYEAIWITLIWYRFHLARRLPLVGTINSMSVASWVPASVSLRVCNPVIVAQQPRRRLDVGVSEIPTDTVYNNPGIDGSGFRQKYGLADTDIVLTVVGRLHPQLKLEGVLSAIAASSILAKDYPVRLVIVGDGPSWSEVVAAAKHANAAAGRETVIMTGALLDPRPAYAGADVVLGMGGSILRAMAMRKPVVVQGERGFWCALTSESAGRFRWAGFYGVGEGERTGPAALLQELTPLLASRKLRDQRGELSSALVNAHYRLDKAAEQAEDLYLRAMRHQCRRSAELVDALGSGGRLAAWGWHRKVAAHRGVILDEQNSLEAILRGLRQDPPRQYLRPWHSAPAEVSAIVKD
jgi:glycosyltransferase involved in cell wall biosynthesis